MPEPWSGTFAPALTAADLQALDAYSVAAVVALENGAVSRPVTLNTPPPPEPVGGAEQVRAASREHYARSRVEIEAAARARLRRGLKTAPQLAADPGDPMTPWSFAWPIAVPSPANPAYPSHFCPLFVPDCIRAREGNMPYLSAAALRELEAKLSERDWQVIERVSGLHFVSANQLARLSFDDDRRAARRSLLRLTRLAVLGRLSRRVGGVGFGSADFAYHLGRAGLRWRSCEVGSPSDAGGGRPHPEPCSCGTPCSLPSCTVVSLRPTAPRASSCWSWPLSPPVGALTAEITASD